MGYNLKIRFKQTAGGFKSKEYKFYDEEDFNQWYEKQIKDESYRKILDWVKID